MDKLVKQGTSRNNKSNTGSKMASFNNSADEANQGPNKLEVSVDKREEGEGEKEIGGV